MPNEKDDVKNQPRIPVNTRKPYKPPTVVRLGELAMGTGACAPGTGVAAACTLLGSLATGCQFGEDGNPM